MLDCSLVLMLSNFTILRCVSCKTMCHITGILIEKCFLHLWEHWVFSLQMLLLAVIDLSIVAPAPDPLLVASVLHSQNLVIQSVN